jgi:VWFA-related protein
VRVDVQVTQGSELVSNLTAEDFQVFDQNLPQKILYVGRDREPLSLLLLLDVSGSMQRYINQVGNVARQSLRFLRPGDRVAVMLFSKGTRVRKDFTDDFGAVADSIKGAIWDESLGSGTAINEAILDAAKYMQERAGEKGRKAVLILTDNLGLNYKSPDQAALNALFAADAVFNAMVVGKAERPEPTRPGHYVNPDFTPPNVFAISDETGGEAVKADRAGETFPVMIERIRTRYSIQYHTPENAGTGFRKIRVELTPAARERYPHAELRYRKGYFPHL